MSTNQVSIFKTIKDYIILSRLFGATNTWGAIFLGAVTSTVLPNISDAVKLLVVTIFAHAYMGALNEYWHIKEDKNNPLYKYKPLVIGDIKTKTALIFIYMCFILTIIFSFVFYPNLLSLSALVLAALFGTLYTVKGKYIAWAYDLTPSVGAAFLVLYGALAVGGITYITIVAALCSFFISLYSEWVGAMKDVDTDRKFKVPTTAVRWGYTHSKPLSLFSSKKGKNPNPTDSKVDRNLLYFIGIVIAIDIIYSLPFFFGLLSPTYFYIFIFIGIPIQLFLIYKLFGKQDKESLRKHPLYFLTSANFLAFVLVIDKIMIWGVFFIIVFIVGWVYLFSLFGIRFSRN